MDLLFANFSSQIYKFWAWKLQSIYGKPIGLGKKPAKEFLKNFENARSRSDKILSPSGYMSPAIKRAFFKIFQKFFCKLFS